MKTGILHTNLLKILVTGGAGFIGRNLVDFLLENNKVKIYDNLSSSTRSDIESLIKKGAEFTQSDILDVDSLKNASNGYDMIIHLAAKSGVVDSILNPEDTYNVNVKGTENVMKCCAENKIKKIIFASSASVYADSKNPLNEKSETNPQSPYGKSKLEAESIIKNYSQKFNISSICLRMFNVYGRGQNINFVGVISKFISDISNDKSIHINGDGKQTRDFVSIHDVIDAFDCAIKNINEKRGTVYNIGSGKSISINELAGILIKISGKKIRIIHEDKKEEVQYSQADTTLAKSDLGFTATRKLEDELRKLF